MLYRLRDVRCGSCRAVPADSYLGRRLGSRKLLCKSFDARGEHVHPGGDFLAVSGRAVRQIKRSLADLSLGAQVMDFIGQQYRGEQQLTHLRQARRGTACRRCFFIDHAREPMNVRFLAVAAMDVV